MARQGTAGAELATPQGGLAKAQQGLAAFGRALRKNPNMAAGFVILAIAASLAIFAPLITTKSPQKLSPATRLRSPSAQAFFGTDQYGRDVYTRVVYGSRLSLLVGASVSALTMVGGVAFGTVAGYNRTVDKVVMRFMDGLMAFPSFLLAVALVAVLGASLQTVITALVVVEAPRMTRIVRASVLGLRERDFVQAARAIGAGPQRILTRHILPNIIAPVIVLGTFVFALAILVEAGLSFLGAGTPPAIPSWGNMMGEGRQFSQLAFWIIFFPGLFLSITVLGANLVGDGLRDTLDPRLRRLG